MRHPLAFGSSGRADRDPRPREPSAPSLSLCGGRVAIFPPRAGEERRPGEVTPTSLSQAGKRGSSFRPLTPRARTLPQHLGQMAPTGFKTKMQPPGGHPCHAATGLPGNPRKAQRCWQQAGSRQGTPFRSAATPRPGPALLQGLLHGQLRASEEPLGELSRQRGGERKNIPAPRARRHRERKNIPAPRARRHSSGGGPLRRAERMHVLPLIPGTLAAKPGFPVPT